MPDQLNHVVAVKALHDICNESEHNVNSGDVRLASSARKDYLLASILLQLLSNTDKEEFTNTSVLDLPTPDELHAALEESSGTASGIVAAPALSPTPTPQPQSADDLARQEAGVAPVTVAGTVEPETGTTERVVETGTGEPLPSETGAGEAAVAGDDASALADPNAARPGDAAYATGYATGA